MTNTYNEPFPRCGICDRVLAGRETILCKHCDRAYGLGYGKGYEDAKAEARS